MNISHLTPKELASYVIAHDSDPIRLRLAQAFEELSSFITTELEDRGMDPVTRQFYDGDSPGEYIIHLEGEVDYYQRELNAKYEELAELEQMTVLNFMAAAREAIVYQTNKNESLYRENRKLSDDLAKTKDKLSMWSALNGSLQK